jgi:hypothetical protein
MKSANQLLTAPVEAGVPGSPEFVDTPGAYVRFGIKKSLLFRLHAEKKIVGVVLRQPGKLRGKRLWVCDSIRAYLLANIAPAEWNPREIFKAKRASVEVTNGAA